MKIRYKLNKIVVGFEMATLNLSIVSNNWKKNLIRIKLSCLVLLNKYFPVDADPSHHTARNLSKNLRQNISRGRLQVLHFGEKKLACFEINLKKKFSPLILNEVKCLLCFVLWPLILMTSWNVLFFINRFRCSPRVTLVQLQFKKFSSGNTGILSYGLWNCRIQFSSYKLKKKNLSTKF